MNNRMYKYFLFLVFVAVLFACAPKTMTEGRTSRNRNVILREEFENTTVLTAYEIIRNIRPQWLRTRGVPTPIAVYINEIQDTLDSLRFLQTENIAKMEYLNANQASARYGIGHGNGAILITLR